MWYCKSVLFVFFGGQNGRQGCVTVSSFGVLRLV